ncbi:MAG TPA: DUF4156 domain-containing protein [Polyangiaceae bacterium]|nr:DUF4156 domain-containing protein [Polyangiaceae bacterium]
MALPVRVGALAFMIVAFAACKRAELTEGGSTVVTGQGGPPAPSCKPLGSVVGSGGGAFGGAYVSNESLMEYALNDLRNKAAKLGANYVTHGQPQLGVAGDQDSTSNTSATVVGSAYNCPSDAAVPDDAISVRGGETARGAEAEPSGAAGFDFGISPAEAESVCTSASFEWRQREREGYFGCSGTPRAVGLDAAVLLKFCEGKLCWVRISGVPKSTKSAAWTQSITTLKTALEQKYGSAATTDVRLPKDCRTEGLLDCLRDGSAHAKFEWKWKTRRVELSMDKAGGEPSIRLVYYARLIQALESDAL